MVHEKAKTTKRNVSCTFATNGQRGGGEGRGGRGNKLSVLGCVCVSSLYALPALLVSVPLFTFGKHATRHWAGAVA